MQFVYASKQFIYEFCCSPLAPCLFQGICIPLNTTINNFRCDCSLGYDGLYCELYTDACSSTTPSCVDNLRCVPSQFTHNHFTCVTRSYSVQMKSSATLYTLLYGNQQWDLRSNINEIYQLEIILKYFLQNSGVNICSNHLYFNMVQGFLILFLKLMLLHFIAIKIKCFT